MFLQKLNKIDVILYKDLILTFESFYTNMNKMLSQFKGMI